MDHDDCVDRAAAQIHKRGKPAEERCVSELEEAAKEDRQPRRMWVGEGEFVEMVNVSHSEVKR